MLGFVARPTKEAPSPSHLAPALLRFAAEHGVDASLLAARCGVADADVEADELDVTSTTLASLLDAVAESVGDRHVALRFPDALPLRRYDAATLAARAASTPAEALAVTARLASLVFPELVVTVTESDVELAVAARFTDKVRSPGLATDEYVLAYLLAHCRRGGTLLTPLRVWLTAARPADLSPLTLVLGTCEIDFGTETTGFALSRDDARRLLPGGDARMVATAEHLGERALARTPRRGNLADAVAARIDAILPDAIQAEEIAQTLHMSGRTLQRRLEDEGTRFSTIVDAVRQKRAERLLLDPTLPLAEIAYQAGFADLATFSRAFKRWKGVPPGSWRRTQGR